MNYFIIIVSFALVISLSLGLYFRIAEYDILAADRVWERIAPSAKTIIDNDKFSDKIAVDITMFSLFTGCGCFTNAMLFGWVKDKVFRQSAVNEDEASEVSVAIERLTESDRSKLFALFNDLMLFDSLHAPILGRVLRMIYRKAFSRKMYRPTIAIEVQESVILKMTRAVNVVAESKHKKVHVPEFSAF